jgi:hypothetical protein
VNFASFAVTSIFFSARVPKILKAAYLSIIFFSAFVQRDHAFGAQVLSRNRNLKTLQMLRAIFIRRGDGISLIGAHSGQQIRELFGKIFPASQQPPSIVKGQQIFLDSPEPTVGNDRLAEAVDSMSR